MTVDAEMVEEELIAAVRLRLRELLPAADRELGDEFARQYYRWVPLDDLRERTPADLTGAVLSQWRLAANRKPGESKLKLGAPDLERDGWESPYTVLEIVVDDMPFLVDSVVMELTRSGYATHLVIHPVLAVKRDEQGGLAAIARSGHTLSGALGESVIHVELDREHDPARLEALRSNLERVLADVRSAVEDWPRMRERATALADGVGVGSGHTPTHALHEAKEFLRWLTRDRFVFLGYREYDLVRDGDSASLVAVRGSGLGILRGEPNRPSTPLGERALALALQDTPLVLTTANSRSTVHRPLHLDYVGVRRYGSDGDVLGERRFLGLYTGAALRDTALSIPIVRDKVRWVLEQAGFPPDSHDAKALTEICEGYSRGSLLQIQPEELLRSATGVLALGERQRVRAFIRTDPLDRYVGCLICLPRDRVTTDSIRAITRILLEAFDGAEPDWSLQRTESTVARMRLVIQTPDGIPAYDEAALEQQITHAIRDWTDDLRDALVAAHGENDGDALYRRYEGAFPPSYRSDWDATAAIADIAVIELLRQTPGPVVHLYRPAGVDNEPAHSVRCKVFSHEPISLSDVLPKFERMGAPVVEERPYEIRPIDGPSVWVYDFGLLCEVPDLETVHELFEQAFLGVWRGDLEHDQLGALVLRAGLTGERIVILRAVTRYLNQAWGAFSDRYMENTLVQYPELAANLVALFIARLDPDGRDDDAAERLEADIRQAIDSVTSLDQDRILRTYLAVVNAILRTNYFQVPTRACLSFKLDPALVGVLPLPLPRFEIFVYSPRVEGVHLRGGKVARGGLRWSDRREDFRTEILGLMKAQMVKNAVIVPVGSKGGFVVKRPPASGDRNALLEEGIECYRAFLRGMLDLTDNIVAGEVLPPPRVVRHDDDDPYLVVAADKGTATFSDIANGVAAEYGFWLGDAFASGGSQGYDHKAIGITARGAWESVKRHFRELGVDIQQEPFTVVGIGDMAGDVFGNGMLLSRQIRLLAAFNHVHVFIDPDPDPAVSFAERERLFETPSTAWSDYDPKLISAGGGVYSRAAKSIPLSIQAQKALGIDEVELAPEDLIRRLLEAPVDLLWNGGIGTYVKASSESHADVGDKTNDALRVDGRDLRCRVVGEGGNLGLTQRGRIEYALAGGRVNTDAIDNVGGVNCSDHEVNIKILLDALVASGELTVDQRNELLVEMTDAVAAQVISSCYRQTQALSIAAHRSTHFVEVHARLIRSLEETAGLHRAVEFLPGDHELAERQRDGRGLVAPELAVLMAYCKIHLDQELAESDLPEDPYLGHDLERYFPPPLPERFTEQMHQHRLRREIIATVVANQVVDRAGMTFVFRMQEETGASPAQITRAYAVAREVFHMQDLWAEIAALDNVVAAETQGSMLTDARTLVEQGTRWLLRHTEDTIDIQALVERYRPAAELLGAALPRLLDGEDHAELQRRTYSLLGEDVPDALAERVAVMPFLPPAFEIAEVSETTGHALEVVTDASFKVAAALRGRS